VFLKILKKLRVAGKDLIVGWYAFHHPSTPVAGKFVLLGLAIYLLSPIDLIPDTFPLLGWLDDLALVSFALPAILKLLPSDVHKQAQSSAEGLLMRVFRSRKH